MIKIGSKKISKDSPVFIIAEAGVNHNGKLTLAKKLVDAAKSAGVDAIKFQTFKTKNVVTAQAGVASYQRKNTGKNHSQFNLLKKLELSYQDFRTLKKYCDHKGIMFLSAPHSPDAVDFLQPLMPAYKIGAGDLTNLPFLKAVAKKFKPIILSTGMADLKEVRQAVATIKRAGNNKIILLHCTTNYPCPDKEVNLRAMETMMKIFPAYLIGYSDHTGDLHTSTMAVTLGARVIEKHFTLDKKMSGPDHQASIEPQELKSLVKSIRRVEVILGSKIKKPTRNELMIREKIRKSVVAIKSIKKGERLSLDNVGIKRPGNGLAPKYFDRLLGKVAKRNIAVDKLISRSDYGR